MTKAQAITKANKLSKSNNKPYFVYREMGEFELEHHVISEPSYYSNPTINEKNVIYHTTEGWYNVGR